ncbi:hypothetical protein [Akkermansia sp.]|uniref:hypothetical protein n=1 Tax=Akkermansia sp. TaxID=1872421 RepID=UPI0025C17263|nr:hypothetical protein [Akkermansia sp.]MCC8149577.1 hypothetical protein [Akkermansia sp.]
MHKKYVNDLGRMKIYFSDFFEVSPDILEDYGAFNISLINDLPLFIDPFLLFNSGKEEYKKLHENIINYVLFLKNISKNGISNGLIQSLFRFPEVRQNWLGYSNTGNKGSGLGKKFALALNYNLVHVFSNFGDEKISQGTHLEKLCLIDSGVGKDNISDFSTNMIKEFLLEYTQKFSIENIDEKFLRTFCIPKVKFNYSTMTWAQASFILPSFENDFVILTPKDILTKDDSWINRADTLRNFDDILSSVPNEELRAHMNQYFIDRLPKISDKEPSKKEEQYALTGLLQRYPEFLDYYIKFKESEGYRAVSLSEEKVKNTEHTFIVNTKELVNILENTNFYKINPNSYQESLQRIFYLKHVIENNDGYRLFYVNGKPIKREKDLQIMFKLTWYATGYDVNAEVNNGRGPVDFKISHGFFDKTLVEFKLASNSKLKDNLAKQVEVYEMANKSNASIKVILYFNIEELEKTKRILQDLKLEKSENIILIDAMKDNKISASKLTVNDKFR